MNYRPDERILKSYAFYKDRCWFVSTIERDYETYAGTTRGYETLVWEYDWEREKRGEMIYQGQGIRDHIRIIKALARTGEIVDENE